jgi:hypothetical protein
MSPETIPPHHAIPDGQRSSLSRFERAILVFLFSGLVLFGGLVEMRSAFLERRMTDLGVYLRAAWAVRTGADLYRVQDNNDWHYHYPPLFAILLVPLADPPAGADRTGLIPFAVSVAFWYAISVLCLIGAVHWLARALEQMSPDPAIRSLPQGCRRWWALRVWPVCVCLPPIGHTLMRGQVNLLLLLLLCGMAAAVLRGRRWQAGLWLAGAICLKIIPALLLIYPLWRRDLRCLAGCALGLVVGFGLIPALVFGPAQTLAYYQEWDRALRQAALTDGSDQSRAKELIEVTATDSQSYLAILHNSLNPAREMRPPNSTPAERLAHWLMGGALTILTLMAGGWRKTGSAETEAVFLGLLVIMMLLLSPVCHLHYFCLSVLAVMGVLSTVWKGEPELWLGWLWLFVLGVNFLANALPHLPGLEYARDFGLATGGTLLLWLAGVATLWRRTRLPTSAVAKRPDVASAAA